MQLRSRFLPAVETLDGRALPGGLAAPTPEAEPPPATIEAPASSSANINLPVREIIFSVPVDLPTSLTPAEIDSIKERATQQIIRNNAAMGALSDILSILLDRHQAEEDPDVKEELGWLIEYVLNERNDVTEDTQAISNFLDWLDTVDPRIGGGTIEV